MLLLKFELNLYLFGANKINEYQFKLMEYTFANTLYARAHFKI